MSYMKEFIAEFYEMRDQMETLGENYVLKDSGERSEFDTGAVRDRATGKGRYDLIAPVAIQRLAIILEKGAAKYEERNWEKGIPLYRYLDSGLRHMFQLLSGDTEEDHAAQAMWNMMAFMWTAEAIMAGRLPESLGKGVPESLWKSKEDPTTFPEFPYEYIDELTGTLHNPGKDFPRYRQTDTPAGRVTEVSQDGGKTWFRRVAASDATKSKDLGSESETDPLKNASDMEKSS